MSANAVDRRLTFAARLINWQRTHGRHDLPWQGTRDPYRVWLSEIMLQQTQVQTVIPYYERFLARFPDPAALAAAPEEDVLALWSGLGYYARARNLHACARRVFAEYGGDFPADAATIATLPGIGRSTAAAIAVFAFGERAAILDGNVKRVLTRAFGIDGYPGKPAVERDLWALAETLLPEKKKGHAGDVASYTQGLMDLGATVCTRTRPACDKCPLAASCVARLEERIAELPTRKEKKAMPTRQSEVLLLRRGDDFLLEKRPPAGIWGGLWALPEQHAGETPMQAAQRLGFKVRRWRTLPPLEHGFTHFKLTIRPSAGEITATLPGVRENEYWRWLSMAEIAEAPLPAPIRRLLEAAAR